jgi:hypothetical protein
MYRAYGPSSFRVDTEEGMMKTPSVIAAYSIELSVVAGGVILSIIRTDGSELATFSRRFADTLSAVRYIRRITSLGIGWNFPIAKLGAGHDH